MVNVLKKSRHIRWNWEESPDNLDWVRYHFIVVDDKNREVVIRKILEQMQNIRTGIDQVRSVEGKVVGSRFRYLFRTYDSDVAPSEINVSTLGKPIRRDLNLKERKKGSIEDYVANIYERS